MRRLRAGQERPDLRYDYDEKAEVKGGFLYRKGDNAGPETWMLPNNLLNLKEAVNNFRDMRDRFNE